MPDGVVQRRKDRSQLAGANLGNGERVTVSPCREIEVPVCFVFCDLLDTDAQPIEVLNDAF